MDDDGTTLILTRPENRSREFLSLCEAKAGRRLSAIISPVIEILPFGDLPDFTAYATVVLTSASAVVRLAGEEMLRGRHVVTVGERTAGLAREAGADAICLGEDVEALLTNAATITAPALHCRGVHARGDLAARLTDRGIRCDEALIYDQVQKPLSPAARAAFVGEGRVILPLFSPRSAQLVAMGGSSPAQLTVIAMSEAVASEWQSGGDIRIAQEPTAQAMCDLVIDAFSRG